MMLSLLKSIGVVLVLTGTYALGIVALYLLIL